MSEEFSSQFRRFLVLSVIVRPDVKLLEMKYLSSGGVYVCHLSHSWYNSYVTGGDIVHVKSDKFRCNHYYVDDEHGLITIGPDKLIWSTWLANSVSCMRKPWLGRLFTTIGEAVSVMDEPSLIGEIVHDIFQTACIERSHSLSQLEDTKKKCLQKERVEKICLLSGLDMEKLTEKVNEYLPSISFWFNQHFQNNARRMYYEVEAVKDIEEIMYSPSLGIEGSLDLTCEVEIHSNPSRRVLVPLELKTGRAFTNFSLGHRTQMMSYAMGMKERGPDRDESGILLYLRNKRGEFKSQASFMQVERSDEIELLQRRNELAYFMSPKNTNLNGPNFVDSKWQCDHCDSSFFCSLMAESFDQDKVKESSAFRRELIKSKLSHLRSEDIEFFRKWMLLLRKKESQKPSSNRFWSEPSVLRQSKGLGLSDLKVHKVSGKILTFTRNPDSSLGISFESCSKLLGKRVAVSEDESCDTVPTKVCKLLGDVLSNANNQIEIELVREAYNFEHTDKTYRLDLMDSGTIFSNLFGNLVDLMLKGDEFDMLHQQQPRNTVIIDAEEAPIKIGVQDLLEIGDKIRSERALKILKSPINCHLIHRLPGFGKKILQIVMQSADFQDSVLISSQSYSSLDTILCKLKDFGIDFIRLGPLSSVHPDITEFSIEEKMKKASQEEGSVDLLKFYGDIKVAGIKCFDVPLASSLIRYRMFNICIIDETEQIPFPIILKLLSMSRHFFLIGDESQVSVMKDEEMSVANYGESLFTMLQNKAHVTQLSFQYHMNSEIMSYSSRLLYGDTLACRSQKIAEAVMPPPSNPTGHQWLDKVLSNELSQSFLFLDTDHIKDFEIDHTQQTELISQIIKEFIQNNGITPDEIGILTPSTSQLSFIEKTIRESEIGGEKIFVNTVEKYPQEGRMVVLVPFDKHENSTDAFLSDAGRLRIALTTAARKLIFIGSKSLLKLHEPFRNLFDLMRDEQFIPIFEALC